MEYRRSRTGNGKKENGYSVEAQFLVIPSPAPAQLSPLSTRSIIVAAIRIPDKTCATYRALSSLSRDPLMSFTFFPRNRENNRLPFYTKIIQAERSKTL